MRIYELWIDALRLSKEGKYEEAGDKYAEIVKIGTDHYWAYNNWGSVIMRKAVSNTGTPEYEGLLNQAEEKCLKAETMKRGSAAYNLACIYALRGNKEKCREWLLSGQVADDFVTKDEAMKDKDLDSVKNEPWFKEIKWKGEK